MPPPVRKQNVLITGASSGLGKATARRFAQEGYRVFGTSRQPHPDKDGIEMPVLDVCSAASVERCIADVLARAGQIDVLVNNAGTWLVGLTEETPMEAAQAVFDTNFFGVVRMVNAVLPGMRRRRQGRIINVGSLAAWVGEPGQAFYAASKRALAGYTEALRHEVWKLGIQVSLVEPGAYQTHFFQGAALPAGAIAGYDTVRRAADRVLRGTLQQGDDPRKVAQVLLRIARTPAPRLRYGTGREAFLPYLKVLLPQRLFDALLRRGYGI